MDKGAGEPTDSAESSEASEPEKHQDETPEKEMAEEIIDGDGGKNTTKTRSVGTGGLFDWMFVGVFDWMSNDNIAPRPMFLFGWLCLVEWVCV